MLFNITRNTTLLPPSNMSDDNQSFLFPLEVDDDECLRSPHYRNTMVTIFLIVIVMSAIENITLWYVFLTKKKLRTVAIAYLISLSASDFVTAATLAWMEVIYLLDYPVWHFGELGSYLINAFWCFSLVTPFTHILFITIDRYRAVTSSTQYSLKKSWKSELIKIAIIWIYSVAIVLLFAFHFHPAPGNIYVWNVLPEWYYPFLAVHIMLPLVIGTILYLKMVAHVKQHRKISKRYIGKRTLQEFRFARSVAIIICFLYLVWIPVIVLESLYATHAHTCFISQLGPISVLLTCTSGVINPIIFLSRNATFREAVFCLQKKHFSTMKRLISKIDVSSNGNSTVPRRWGASKDTPDVTKNPSTSSEIPLSSNSMDVIDNVFIKSDSEDNCKVTASTNALHSRADSSKTRFASSSEFSDSSDLEHVSCVISGSINEPVSSGVEVTEATNARCKSGDFIASINEAFQYDGEVIGSLNSIPKS